MKIGNCLILGDSYSTFEGYIPNGYATWYYNELREGTDVNQVEQTWWKQLLIKTNANLILNNSWSGSTICYTGYGNADCSKSSSFIYRLRQLQDNGFFEENKIDTVFVFGATNDSWCGAQMGKVQFSDWEEKDLYYVLPAMTYLFKTLRDILPNANIVCIINTELKYEITTLFFEICKKYNAKQVFLKDISKKGGHPDILGMSQICDQILENI